jgi:LPXTG-site transpeptidase (sortase) family protein
VVVAKFKQLGEALVRRLKNLSRRQRIAAAVTCLITIASLATIIFIATRHSEPPLFDKDGVVTYSTSSPDESPASASSGYQWHGSPEDPQYIKLPSIDAEGYIQKMGVDQNRQVSAPTNINLAGWFVNSSRPGSRGLSVIDGHVDGQRSDGIFKSLGSLKPDDTFEVKLGNGEVLTYQVMSVQTTAAAEAASLLFSQDPKVASQLNLITCAGRFDSRSQRYDKRVVISSKLVTK